MTRTIELAAALAVCGASTACTDILGPEETAPPTIEHLGIDIGLYDPDTQTASDITFVGGEAFIPFGKLLEGTNGLKRTPELTWFVQEGTAVRAPISGRVSQIDVLYSDDYLIVLKQDGNPWEIGVEHVVDPQVGVGDEVTAGQVIATATPEPTPFGTVAFTELAVWYPASTDDQMIKRCPYLSFSPALRQEFAEEIHALAQAWEEHREEDVFDEDGWTQPGCVVDEMTEAEARNPGG